MTGITLSDFTLGYEGHAAVHHLSGTFAAASMTAIMGPNGSGKSTLLKGMMGLIRPMHGHADFAGATVAYLPQLAEFDMAFPATVMDLVSLGLWRSRGWFGRHTTADRQRLEQALRQLGLEGFAERPVSTLSGGQLQRALFARLMVEDAAVLLLDEPFAAIDQASVDDIIRTLKDWAKAGKTIIAVLHEAELVRAHFPETLLLAREKIFWGPTHQALAPENFERARAMHEAWDENAPWCAKPVEKAA